jgi:hypothetical protein
VRRALGATLAAWAAFAPHAAAQQVVVTDAGPGQSAAIIRQVVAGPHVVRAGSGRLELPRDSVISSSLLVLGRPTYLASRVQGDVVVVGADLFLRPGVDITGRAVAIGGTVAETTLGQVAGGVESLRDETYVVSGDSTRYSLAYRSDRVEDEVPVFQLAGIKGLLPPRYDRVDGLSLPVGVAFVFAGGAIELQPSVTYRSRLGAWDPAASLRVGPEAGSRFEGRVARDTRTNEGWIYSDLINSATSFFVGTDTRNYFRSDLGEGRLIAHVERNAFTIEPYVGGRYERVSPITSVGNVWSLFERGDTLKMLRPNPLVEKGSIGSALVGARLESIGGEITSRLSLEAEQSFTTPVATSSFLQLTVDGRVEFPTFRTQRLQIRAHGVATHGDAVPLARYAYIGGSGSLGTLELLEQGGTSLMFVASRYLIPIEKIVLPYVGSPVLSLRDAFGGAGVGSIPQIQHEIGVGIGVSALHVDLDRGVAGRKRTKFSVSLSLSQ